jgi:hypothetical protein
MSSATTPAAPDAKPWWQSRTLIVNAVALGLAAAEAHVGLLAGVLPGTVYQWLAFGLPVINAVLRFVTNQGVTL